MRSRTPNTNAKLNTNPSNMLINDSPPSKLGATQKSSVDYLGNSIDLNGFDWSFTLEFKQLLNSDQKEAVERQNLVFFNR